MKLNELISSFSIHTTNEESDILKKLDQPNSIESFSEREQFIINNMVRKSLVSKIKIYEREYVVSNEQEPDKN